MIEPGPAKYFHGRYEELNIFHRFLLQTKREQMGSSMLVQGPPGVGKSALIHQLGKEAKEKDWMYPLVMSSSFTFLISTRFLSRLIFSINT